ncbi:MAG: sulfite exporter TauE/SafE family protein [Proteobacteria bacterium]|nr:sulfite exporter TauE/SafE family protein [Pseudomonadota bacterium]
MSLVTPLLIGLFSSIHCLAMCGGLCGIFCQNNPSRKTILVINIGRITTYTVLGLIFAGLVQGLALRIPFAEIGFWLRSTLGIVLLFLGIRILLNKSSLHTFFENNFLWEKAKTKLHLLNNKHATSANYLKGILWGMIPCGLLYGVLLAAATTNNIYQGGLFMLAFGIGTLPSMFIAAGLLKSWSTRLQSKSLRYSAGIFIVIIGLWSLISPWFSHGLIPHNSVFTPIIAFLDSCVP